MNQAEQFALQRRMLDAAPISKFLIGKELRHRIDGDLERRVTEGFALESQGPPVAEGPSEPGLVKFTVISLPIVTLRSVDPEMLGARLESLLFRGDDEGKGVHGLNTCKALWAESPDDAASLLLDRRFYGPFLLLTGLSAVAEVKAKIVAFASSPFVAANEFILLQLTPDVFRFAGICFPEVFRDAQGRLDFRWVGSPQFRCDFRGNVGIARGRLS